jgi:hypothetical protein
MSSVEVQRVTDDIKLSGFKSAQEAMNFAKVLIDSKMIPTTLKTPESVVAVILQGRELGFGPLTSLNNINNIQGKTVLNVHAIAAKLAMSGLAYELVQDYEPIKNEEGKTIDYVTTFKFFKKWNDMVINNIVSYRWSEAVKAGLTSKDNWVKMGRIMMRARALAIGARLAAPEAMLGMYETTELADAKGINYEVTEEGEVTIIE